MQIDWLTVIAQIVNFLVLVWLLKHFLYQPVLKAMNQREQLIMSRLEQATKRESEALAARLAHEEAQNLFMEQRQSLFDEAYAASQQRHQELLEEARLEVEKRRQDWQKQMDSDSTRFVKDLTRSAAIAVQSTARHLLSELANTDLEKQLINAFIERLDNLSTEQKRIIAASTTPIEIVSAQALGADYELRLKKAIRSKLQSDVDIKFRVSAQLIAGIELATSDYRLGWNLKDYLDAMESAVEQELEQADALTR